MLTNHADPAGALNGGLLLPSVRWVRSALRHNLVARARYQILAAYIVGSVAKRTARPDSDLDIAVIIPPVRGRSTLQITERYHAKFEDDRCKPRWHGRVVDVQFFYEDDPELQTYSRIELGR